MSEPRDSAAGSETLEAPEPFGLRSVRRALLRGGCLSLALAVAASPLVVALMLVTAQALPGREVRLLLLAAAAAGAVGALAALAASLEAWVLARPREQRLGAGATCALVTACTSAAGLALLVQGVHLDASLAGAAFPEAAAATVGTLEATSVQGCAAALLLAATLGSTLGLASGVAVDRRALAPVVRMAVPEPQREADLARRAARSWEASALDASLLVPSLLATAALVGASGSPIALLAAPLLLPATVVLVLLLDGLSRAAEALEARLWPPAAPPPAATLR